MIEPGICEGQMEENKLIVPIFNNAPPLPKQRCIPEKNAEGKIVNWLHYDIKFYWPYHDIDGNITHYVVRYTLPDGEKETPPLVLMRTQKGVEWVFKSPPEPRPLFNLHLLKKYPTAQVLIVEGEKKAEAARILFEEAIVRGKSAINDIIPIAWQGGSNAVYKTDWEPILNRQYILWPDNDLKTNKKTGELLSLEEQPGYKAMLQVAGILANPTKTKIVNPDQTKPDTWDIADAILEDHWDFKTVFSFIRSRVTALPEKLPEPPAKKSVSSLVTAAELTNEKPLSNNENELLKNYTGSIIVFVSDQETAIQGNERNVESQYSSLPVFLAYDPEKNYKALEKKTVVFWPNGFKPGDVATGECHLYRAGVSEVKVIDPSVHPLMYFIEKKVSDNAIRAYIDTATLLKSKLSNREKAAIIDTQKRIDTTDLIKQIYFIKSSKENYAIPFEDGTGWYIRNEKHLKEQLSLYGYSRKKYDSEDLSAADREANRIRQENNVSFAGPVAGYLIGPQIINSQKVLITEQAKFPQLIPGSHKIIDSLLQNALGEEQKQVFEYYLKGHLSQLYRSQPHQQQVAIFIGSPGSGKSMIQRIVGMLCGGREAKVYQYLTGQDNFNGSALGAEHLVLEDESPILDPRARQTLTVGLTNLAVGNVQRIRSMHQESVFLTPIWIVTMSANESNISTLPFINESSGDKLMIFKTVKTENGMPMPTRTDSERKAFIEQIKSEIPAYANYLINKLKIPEHMLDDRYTIKKYHNEEIIKLFENETPAEELMSILDLTIDTTQSFTSTELIVFLSKSSCSRRAEKILRSAVVAGRLLQELSKRYPERVFFTSTMRRYTIKPSEDIKNQVQCTIGSWYN